MGRHPGRTTPCFLYFDLIIGMAALVLFLWSCKIENITLKCTHSSAHPSWRYICQQTADICSQRCWHSHLSTHIVNVWAQMQTHMLSLHCSQGVDGYWRLKVYCGWLANYYTSWGIQPASFNQHWSDTKTVSHCFWLAPFMSPMCLQYPQNTDSLFLENFLKSCQ